MNRLTHRAGKIGLIPSTLILLTFLSACTSTVAGGTEGAEEPEKSPTIEFEPEFERNDPATYDDLEIVTLLPRDAIPAIDSPQFMDRQEADEFYDPDELVMGVNFNGDARAYSVPFLSRHEIVNDTVGGVKIAVTW